MDIGVIEYRISQLKIITEYDNVCNIIKAHIDGKQNISAIHHVILDLVSTLSEIPLAETNSFKDSVRTPSSVIDSGRNLRDRTFIIEQLMEQFDA